MLKINKTSGTDI